MVPRRSKSTENEGFNQRHPQQNVAKTLKPGMLEGVPSVVDKPGLQIAGVRSHLQL